MHREISTAAGHGGAFSYDNELSQPTAFDLSSLYSSMLLHPTGLLLDDSQNSTETTVTPVLTPRFRQSQSSNQLLIDQHYQQDLMDRHNRVLSQLLETEKKTLALRQENINLKMANFNLNNRLSSLLSDYGPSSGLGLDNGLLRDYGPSSGLGLNNGLRRMHVGLEEEMSSDGHSWEDVVADRHLSPTSVMDSGRVEGVDRILLPKSISVRSSGYLKTIHAAGGSSKQQNRAKASSVNTAQRVYVKGGNEKEEQPLELDVYNQGMFKTELCNKWQETAACPYGDNCQFAHGIEELRPVLRHPRYKTEVCRMVLNGDPCPYGHRCHFRHTLTDQEKLMRSLNTTSSLSLKP
ncbi:Zinc finger CCCH domain-containing protein 14 [Capsicum annuum]|uniref:Zinc finger CCCH domain-containing protein 14 n=1 Tax=Capsicum annuum TaxID=4072 RepID=A0A1U8ETD7_CAPAN|nr:zinc finger CCCH domain-containing protein 15 [Capsicum annuum]XP_016546635.1 zinc finger CCCH domain-containing protein 15 [Capsicum annuum]KAF3633915.1 Zinc finger CCCH domain-containing protein 14 [Capsicum annuum]KAF3643424.1 Zinc finger CCCH domain-containing protein 14 [Capsicum annuum]PHT67269.1 Zinc finger CCCH domain-containing protein 14 [Capsicum annuum]